MKITELHTKVTNQTLTCSEVMELMMNQPTAPVNRKVESHAHFHTLEGFHLNRSEFKGDDFSFERKQMHWEHPTHLYPQGVFSADFGRYVYPSGHPVDYGVYHGVFQDPDRLPPDRSFADRTGLGALPPLTRTTYRVFKKKAKERPTEEIYDSLEQIQSLKVGNAEGEYLPKKTGSSEIKYIEKVDLLAPSVQESPAHSLFPDTESAIMHLTAALMSNAGISVINKLKNDITPGEQKTVAIFSKTAVRTVAVISHGTSVTMLEHRLEVDTTRPRDGRTGFYPTTGRILNDEFTIDHVVVVLGHRATGDINVITCYPSRKTTAETIGTTTNDFEDIAELEFGTHTKVGHTYPLPCLRW